VGATTLGAAEILDVNENRRWIEFLVRKTVTCVVPPAAGPDRIRILHELSLVKLEPV